MLDNWTFSNTQIVAVLAEYPVEMSVMSHSDVWPTLIMNDFLLKRLSEYVIMLYSDDI